MANVDIVPMANLNNQCDAPNWEQEYDILVDPQSIGFPFPHIVGAQWGTWIIHQGQMSWAASKARSDGTRIIAMNLGPETIFYHLTSTGLQYLTHASEFTLLLSGFDNNFRRAECELITLPGQSGYRIAVQGLDLTADVVPGVLVADFDYQTLTLIPGSRKFLPYPQPNNTRFTMVNIRGIEFAGNGSYVYVTHTPNAAYPVPFDLWDISGAVPVRHELNMPLVNQFSTSFIETAANGNLYLASDSHLAQYSNPDTPNFGNLAQAWNPAFAAVNYASNKGYPGAQVGILTAAHVLPDQIDGELFSLHYEEHEACCIAFSQYDANIYCSSGTEIWEPGAGNNPFGSATGAVYIRNELRIKQSTRVTIKNMTFYFAPDARVVIEDGGFANQGGKLILGTPYLP